MMKPIKQIDQQSSLSIIGDDSYWYSTLRLQPATHVNQLSASAKVYVGGGARDSLINYSTINDTSFNMIDYRIKEAKNASSVYHSFATIPSQNGTYYHHTTHFVSYIDIYTSTLHYKTLMSHSDWINYVR